MNGKIAVHQLHSQDDNKSWPYRRDRIDQSPAVDLPF
jgi:hypothetical protein